MDPRILRDSPWEPHLVKYCERRFNAAAESKTIKIGTLDYYRRLDPSFTIADATEGIYSIKVVRGDGDGVLTRDQVECVSGGTVSLTSEMRLNPDGEMNLTWQATNCFVFSATVLDDESQLSKAAARAISPEYDSWYAIQSPSQFSMHIGNAILRLQRKSVLAAESLESLASSPLGGESALRLRMKHGRVRYVDSRELTVPAHQLDSLPDIYELKQWSAFLKTADHSAQSEYRFTWWIESAVHGALDVAPDPVLLKLNPFDDILTTENILIPTDESTPPAGDNNLRT